MTPKSQIQLAGLAAYARKKPPKRGAHAGLGGPSVRAFKVGTKKVEILTQYRVRVNGKPFRISLEVAGDGSVICRELPFYRANSAVDVVKHALEQHAHHKTLASMRRGKAKTAPKSSRGKDGAQESGGR